MLEISAEDLLKRPHFALLDVRAEVEFADGHIPGSVNFPILTNQERHEVGICYKEEGPSAAMALGYALVSPHKLERVAAWKAFLSEQSFPVLTCFRGGTRSEIARKWLHEVGMEAARVKGGYKAMRRVLAREWDEPLRGYVLTGLTGADKTGFLRSLNMPRAIDLEEMAMHRGSAFGGLFQPGPQPAQQTFENRLSLALKRLRPSGELLFEDESRLVGRCVIPPVFFEKLKDLPRIYLEASDEERAEHIHRIYVAAPLKAYPPEKVEQDLLGSIRSIRNKLGGLAAAEIEKDIREALADGDRDRHQRWILRLLREYYDGMYKHAMARHPSKPIFQGKADDCREWLKANTDLFKK